VLEHLLNVNDLPTIVHEEYKVLYYLKLLLFGVNWFLKTLDVLADKIVCLLLDFDAKQLCEVIVVVGEDMSKNSLAN
jgi:hypothetical protein